MTEMYTRPVVKLPRKRDSIQEPYRQLGDCVPSSFLVSDRLYMEDMPAGVSDEDIMELLRTCEPLGVHLNRTVYPASGTIVFPGKEYADRAYTLFNGASFRNRVRLQLRIYPPHDQREPEPESGILQIKHLPLHFNSQLLYDILRPYGPMSLCKIIVEQQSAFKGTALAQYFDADDAEKAIAELHNKNIHGSIISVQPFRYPKPRSPVSDSTSPSTQARASTVVDYTNLYIKNLDPNVESADLYSHFQSFGKIISARVMKNTQTNQPRGFGFVSFQRPEDAARARQEMNGKYIFSKPIIVAFHEPKRSRPDKQNSPRSSSPNTRPSLSPISPSVPEPVLPPHQTHPHLAQPVQKHLPKQHNDKPKNGTVAKVPTPMDTPAAAVSDKKQRMINAIRECLGWEQCQDLQEIEEIADMLLTLQVKERSLCLFNHDFLSSKIALARGALAICRDDLVQQQSVPTATRAPQTTPMITPPSSGSAKRVKYQDSSEETIRHLLASLDGLDINEKKDKLGNHLYPIVKATGFRPAPKITVMLLDTVPLEELVYTMYNTPLLQQKVKEIAKIIQASHSD